MKFLILASLFVLSVYAEAEPEAKADADAEADPWFYQFTTGFYPHAVTPLSYALPYMGYYTVQPQNTNTFYTTKSHQYGVNQGKATMYDKQGNPVEISNYPAKTLQHYMKMLKNVQTPTTSYNYNTQSNYEYEDSYNGYNTYNFGQNRVRREAEADAEAEPEAEAEAEAEADAEADPWYYSFGYGYPTQAVNAVPYTYPIMGYYAVVPQQQNMATRYQYQQQQYQTPTAEATLYDQEGKTVKVQNFPSLPLNYYMKMVKTDKNQQESTATIFDNEGRALKINNYQAKPLQHYMRMLKNVQTPASTSNFNTQSIFPINKYGYNTYNPVRTERSADSKADADIYYSGVYHDTETGEQGYYEHFQPTTFGGYPTYQYRSNPRSYYVKPYTYSPYHFNTFYHY